MEVREIKWNAINLKSGNGFTSRDINFYKVFSKVKRSSTG